MYRRFFPVKSIEPVRTLFSSTNMGKLPIEQFIFRAILFLDNTLLNRGNYGKRQKATENKEKTG
jgi:hypothetical protein